MKYKFFAIPAMSPETASNELDRFLTSTRIASVEKQLIPDGDSSFWSFCISYYDKEGGGTASSYKKVDYREVLSEPDFAVFAKLRTLRKNLAEQEGVPAYAVFSNEQLA